MKKQELIEALNEVRVGLNSETILKTFDKAISAQKSDAQMEFAQGVMAHFVIGIGNFERFTPAAKEVCKHLQVSPLYESATNSNMLHHIAAAKATFPGLGQQPGSFLGFLNQPPTLVFMNAHRRIITTSDLLNVMLHSSRPEGELLLEGVSEETGPSLESVQEVLATVAELVAAYCASQGHNEKPKIEISYLDLGSNFQIGVKVDGKAEVGKNLNGFLSEVFRYITNPRAYMRERRVEGMMKEITLFAELQKRVTAGELTPEVANEFAKRLLGAGENLANQHVFPASLLRENQNICPADEVLKLMSDAPKQLALSSPKFEADSTNASNPAE